jgi:hypothetical protein
MIEPVETQRGLNRRAVKAAKKTRRKFFFPLSSSLGDLGVLAVQPSGLFHPRNEPPL